MDFGLSSEHSKTYKGREEESVQMHEETSDHHSIKDKQAKKISETTNDHSSSKDSRHESRSSNVSEGQKDVNRRDESNKNNNHSDAHINSIESTYSSGKKSRSSSSSESSSDDLLGIEKAFKCSKSDESILASKSGKDYVSSSESSDKCEVGNSLLVPIPTYDVYNLSHSQNVMSPTATPPAQVMVRSGRRQASSIPSWVFDRNTNQSEWSIGSNDSLFSIQLGQASFSRDMALHCGELDLSGELTKSSDSSNQSASVVEDEIDNAIKNVVENLQTAESSHGSSKSEGEELKAYNQLKNESYKSSKSTASSVSKSSETGMCPVDLSLKKKKKRSRRWCYYKCSKMFCSFWPTRKCSDSCGAFSCCWKYNRTKYRPHTSPILTEAERSDSTKMDSHKQELEIQQTEVTSKSTASSCGCFGSKQESGATSKPSDSYCKWFNCFSCSSCTWISCSRCQCCR